MQQVNRSENKIKNHYGIPDYYKWYCNNHENKTNRKLFNKIIGEFNLGVIDLILNEGIEYTPPKLQMSLVIRKTKRVPKIEDGKLVNKLPVDFKATKELWNSNPEAKEKKILVRHLNQHTGKYIFGIKLLKIGNTYSNKKYYAFQAARDFKRSLAKRIFDEDKNTFDTFNLY